MHRLNLFTCVLALLAVACGDDTAATGISASDSADTTTATTDGPATTSTTEPGETTTGVTTGPGTTTSEPGTTGPGTTTDATTTTTTVTGGETTGPDTGDTTATSDTPETTGGPLMCGVEGPKLTAELVHLEGGNPCGPLTFEGQNVGGPKGPLWQLDGCPCGAACLQPDPWTLTMAAPDGWLPQLPECPRIVVDRFMGFGVCEFAAISVWDVQQPDAPALYHAGHGFTPVAEAADELTLEALSQGTCACDGCCNPPELFELGFTLLGDAVVLAEGEESVAGAYTVANFESHNTGICDAPLSVHWAIKTTP